MFEVVLPEQFRELCTIHENGGGIIGPGTTIDKEVFVERGSIVLGGQYSGNVRITGEAVVVACTLTAYRESIKIIGGHLNQVGIAGAKAAINSSSLLDVEYKPGSHQNNVVDITGSTLTKCTLQGNVTVVHSIVTEVAVEDSTIERHKLTVNRPSLNGALGILMGSRLSLDVVNIRSMSSVSIEQFNRPN